MVLILKHVVFWAPFSEFLVVSLVSMHHHSPVSEPLPSHVQCVATVKKRSPKLRADLNGKRSRPTK